MCRYLHILFLVNTRYGWALYLDVIDVDGLREPCTESYEVIVDDSEVCP